MSPNDRKRRYEESVRNCTQEQVTAIEGQGVLKTLKELQARILYREWQLDLAYVALAARHSHSLDSDASLQQQHA